MISKKIKNAVLTVCTISLLLSMCGCGKKTKDITDNKQVTDFFKNEMKARKISMSDAEDLNDEQWERGFYVQDSGFIDVNSLDYNGLSIIQGRLVYAPAPLTYLKQSFKELDSDADPDSIVDSSVYCLITFDQGDKEEITVGKIKVKTYEEFLTSSFVFHYDFADEDDALSFFESFVDKYFDSEAYEVEFETQREKYEDSHPSFTIPINIVSADAEIKDREIYDLKDLPKSVYELDKKKQTGHFTINASTSWAVESDIFRTNKPVSQCISVIQGNIWFSMEIKGNIVVVTYDTTFNFLNNTPDVYYDQWPTWDVKYNEKLKNFTKSFGLSDPEKADINEDLNIELCSTARMSSGTKAIQVFFPEVYVREGDTTLMEELYGD